MSLPEPDLGPIIGDIRHDDVPDLRVPVDPVETLKRWLWVIIGVVYAVVFLGIIFGGLLIYSSAAKAAKLTPVLSECIELAQREGFPTDFLTRLDVARAKLRMSRLSDRDPLVRACREAIKAARATNPTGGPP